MNSRNLNGMVFGMSGKSFRVPLGGTVRRILINSVDFVNNSVEVNSDNRNVPHILKVGIKKKALQDITMSLHSLYDEKHSFELHMVA